MEPLRQFNDNQFDLYDLEAFFAAVREPDAAPNPALALETLAGAIDLQRFLLERFKVEIHFCQEYANISSVPTLINGEWELFDCIRFYRRIDYVQGDLGNLEIAVTESLRQDEGLSAVQEECLSAALQEIEDKCRYLQDYAHCFKAVFWGTCLNDGCVLYMYEYEGVSLNDKFTTDSPAVNSWKASRAMDAAAEIRWVSKSFVPFECKACAEMLDPGEGFRDDIESRVP
jgi:hypothetical protein